MVVLVLAPQLPGDCLLTGLCGSAGAPAGPPSGLMFIALGLVLLGALGWWRSRQRPNP
jgi:MYXO-CTERM domain-containing protein